MSLRSELESLVDCSFSSKCSEGKKAFNEVDSYLRSLGRDGLSAMDATLLLCISVMRADYDFSDTEILFLGEVSGNIQPYTTKDDWLDHIIPEIRRDEHGYIAWRIRELEEAPLEIRRSAMLLICLAAVCDHELSYAEISEVERWMNKLSLIL